MDLAKLALSEEELRLVMDPGVILTKNAIIRKVYTLFGDLSEMMQKELILPAEVASISPKISKGESYQGLPYVMLDYPRSFSVEHVLAIRTFFWWGNFFSVNLHLKGRFRDLCQRSLIRQFDQLAREGYSIAIGEDEWQHDLASGDYRKLDKISEGEFADLVAAHPFVRISRSYSLDQWDMMHILLRNSQQELGRIIGPMTS